MSSKHKSGSSAVGIDCGSAIRALNQMPLRVFGIDETQTVHKDMNLLKGANIRVYANNYAMYGSVLLFNMLDSKKGYNFFPL